MLWNDFINILHFFLEIILLKVFLLLPIDVGKGMILYRLNQLNHLLHILVFQITELVMSVRNRIYISLPLFLRVQHLYEFVVTNIFNVFSQLHVIYHIETHLKSDNSFFDWLIRHIILAGSVALSVSHSRSFLENVENHWRGVWQLT